MRAVFAVLLALSACGDRDEGPPLDQQWTKVVALSRPRVEPADSTLLQHAIDAVYPERDRVREALEAARSSGQPPELSPEIAATAEALESWYQERGGLPRRSCLDQSEGGRRVLAAVTLADLALATAPAGEPQTRLEAVLYLGHRLREEGANLLDITAGSEIADKAIIWATEKKVAPTAAFRELAPGPELLSRAIAAEAQCMIELARQPSDQPLARSELDALRRFYIAAVDDLARGGSDDDLLVRLGAMADKAHADRRHPTLAITVPSLGRLADRLLEQRRRYHAFLRGIR